jgi:hypothetical protein
MLNPPFPIHAMFVASPFCSSGSAQDQLAAAGLIAFCFVVIGDQCATQSTSFPGSGLVVLSFAAHARL